MTNNGNGKRPWTKPELRQIVAGSAEAGTKSVVADGAGSGNRKS